MHRIRVIDTHTAGEPTRVILSGGPDLGSGPLHERRTRWQTECDRWRSALVNEPRGSDVLVGALVVPPHTSDCAAGVLFCNNVGYLGMCGHGLIGVLVALGHAGILSAGTHRMDTPVGVVSAEYDGANTVTLTNVPSYRLHAGVALTVPGYGPIVGDVAWGGNWFFLTPTPGLDLTLANCTALLAFAQRVRSALATAGITGTEGAVIDHIELIGPPLDAPADARNFVLCPGGAYDRSPCGTGTSAKLACLFADGHLQPGQTWRQASVLGTVFTGRVTPHALGVVPHLTGRAYVTAEATLLIDERDPLAWGIPTGG
jgi:4-hydroxyproline epimerase